MRSLIYFSLISSKKLKFLSIYFLLKFDFEINILTKKCSKKFFLHLELAMHYL